MIRIGETIPDIELRTDEGTPLSLADLAGRRIALFLIGEAFSPSSERLLKVIAQNTGRFLSLDYSPVTVSGEPVAELSKYRKLNDVPFLMMSDSNGVAHSRLRGEDGAKVGVWLLSEDSVVLDTLPNLPPTELVSVVMTRLRRIRDSLDPSKKE